MSIASLFGRICKSGKSVTCSPDSLNEKCAPTRGLPVPTVSMNIESVESQSSDDGASCLTPVVKSLSAHRAVILIDYDDTLFPTSWLRKYNPGRKWYEPLPVGHAMDVELRELAFSVCLLLRRAKSLGEVVILSLARPPWIGLSLGNFFPEVGALIEDLEIPIVYAVEEIRAGDENEDETELGIRLKGRAMLRHIKRVAKQNGCDCAQSNSYECPCPSLPLHPPAVLSIGDSLFERFAAHEAVGQSEENSMRKPKTLKLFEDPTAEKLHKQVKVVEAWLPAMVAHQEGFDLDLEESDLKTSH